MNPRLLPSMLLRESYETTAPTTPKFPVGKTVAMVGVSSATVVAGGTR